MTKAHRIKAMGRVITACQQIKDKKPLAEAVRQIVEDLHAEEQAFKVQARIEHAANIAAKQEQAVSVFNELTREERELIHDFRCLTDDKQDRFRLEIAQAAEQCRQNVAEQLQRLGVKPKGNDDAS